MGGVDSDFCPGETDAGRWTGYVPLFRWDRAFPLTTPSVEVSLHSLCVARIRLASGASSVTSFNRWQQPGLWPGMRSIVMVEVTREIGARMTKKRRCYVSSLPRTRHASPIRCAPAGALKTTCAGVVMWPLAKASAGCAWITPRRTSTSPDASS